MNARAWGTAAALLLPAAGAFALNAPSDPRVVVTAGASRLPDLIFGFNSNEDRVWFAFEVTIDGVPYPPGGVTDSLHCIRSSANANDCHGLNDGHIDPGPGDTGWRAIVFAPGTLVAFDTEYCFRVRSLNTHSERSAWAPWACARTPSRPERPERAPSMPKLTLLEGAASGLGQIGPAKPARLLIEWSRNLDFDGWFGVERASAQQGSAWQEVGRVSTSENLRSLDLELVDEIQDAARVPGVNNPTNYRVCAANVGGKVCSTASRYPLAALKQAVDSAPALSRHPNAVAVASTGVPAALRIAAPQILSPKPGGSVMDGQLRLQVSAPGLESSAAEVEFSRQESRPRDAGVAANATPVTATWKTSMATLARGVQVPAGEGPTQAGVWVARVRSVRGLTPDPWSEPVSFTLIAPAWVKAATTTSVANAPARAIAAVPLAATPLQKAPTGLGARPSSTVDWGKAAPSALAPQAPRLQP